MDRPFVWVEVCAIDGCKGRFGEPFDVSRVDYDKVQRDLAGLVSKRHGETARKAALEVRPCTGTQRDRILRTIDLSGWHGITRDELADRLSMSPNTVRPRVKELLDGGHIKVALDYTRKSNLGRDSEVLVGRRWPE
jgi:hypothetical protein